MIHEKKLLSEGIKETLIPGLKIIGANTDLAAAEVELSSTESILRKESGLSMVVGLRFLLNIKKITIS